MACDVGDTGGVVLRNGWRRARGTKMYGRPSVGALVARDRGGMRTEVCTSSCAVRHDHGMRGGVVVRIPITE